ncbi:MAG: putative type dipeptide/oligopeptide transport system, periplasmic component [Ramlibacter sp.]|nr:putative type dipeptide/oligopeptide transport system, periplasmic component [Ramlibacter sp.]
MRIKYALVCAAAATALAAPALQAKPFRWASAGEISTWDIHSQNNALQNGIHAAVYESLVYYNSRTFKIEPVLATSWTQVSPTQMRLNLRQNVKFHDGSAFTADDAAYSMVLLNQLTELRMMSKAWAEKNNSVEPKDIRNVTLETFANRNAMGTGPFILRQWVPDQRMVMAANSPQDLPRLRQSPNLKVMDGVESRTIFFGMDQHRDELPGSNVKGKNPLKDLRVRKALYQAIDIDSLMRVTMRGLGQATGALVAPQVNGWKESIHKRMPYDVEGAKKLLAEAGYPQGFEVDFACPNNRYINDEEICQAVTAMWSRIGVRAKLRTMPLVTYFPMIQRFEASIYMLGWGVPTFDAMYSLQSLVRTPGSDGDGNYNVGRYSNPKVDAVIDRAKVETDLLVRNRLLTDALQMSNDDVSHIPLHNQVIPWAMKRNIELVHRPDNRLDWRLIKVN